MRNSIAWAATCILIALGLGACGSSGGGGGSSPSTDNNNPGVSIYSIAGKVAESSGAGIAGVAMALTSSSSVTVSTDNSGNYTFTGLTNGTYTITPTKTGYTCSPVSKTITVNNANVTGQDFVGTDTVVTATSSVAFLGDRVIWYYPDEHLYRLAFSFKNASLERIASNATVTITINNDNNVEVYKKTHSITTADFATWTNAIDGSRYMATIKILYSEILPALKSSGTVSFSVTADGGVAFPDSTLPITSLPTVTFVEANIGDTIALADNKKVIVEKFFYVRNSSGIPYLHLGNKIIVAKITVTNGPIASLFVSPLHFHIVDGTTQIDYDYYTYSYGQYDDLGQTFTDNESMSLLANVSHTFYVTFKADSPISDGQCYIASSDSDYPIRVAFTKSVIK